jgi:hypothetical protein
VSRANFLRTAVFAIALVHVLGCHQNAPQFRPSDAERGTHARSNILGFAELRTANLNNALEAVARLRPEFLRTHGAPSAVDPNRGLPTVFLDGVRQGGLDALRSIPVGAVYEIRYLSASAAAADQYGPFYHGGVIAVRTRR